MKTIRIIILSGLILWISACDESDYNYSSDTSSETGTGGSLARFAIAGNYLYTVDYSKLKTFDISDEKNPSLLGEIYVNQNAETIFAKGDLLFLGTQLGVYIYDISDPAAPQYISQYSHVQSCDPVVVHGNYAYSTLNSDGPCGRGLNELDIIDISNPRNPDLVRVIDMNSPRGLGISGSLLFVCDESLQVFDITDPTDPDPIKYIDIDAVDVIPIDTLLLIATEQGLAEYSIDAGHDIHYLSSLYSIQ
jgi:hypothetical protein